MANALDDFSQTTNRPLSDIIRDALRQHLQSHSAHLYKYNIETEALNHIKKT